MTNKGPIFLESPAPIRCSADGRSTPDRASPRPRLHSPFKPPNLASWLNRHARHLFLGTAAASLLCVSLWILAPSSALAEGFSVRHGFVESVAAWGQHAPANSDYGALYPPAPRGVYCDVCDCSQDPPLPKSSVVRRGPARTADELGAYVQSHLNDIYCPHIFAKSEAGADFIRRARTRPEEIQAWNLGSITPGKPTLYLFTKTAPHGKTGPNRVAYMKRHADTISRHRANVTERGYYDGKPGEARQTLWIIVEDNHSIDRDIAKMLAQQNQPYIYVAFGPTKRYGNAQLNAALIMIHALSTTKTGVLGHGPVISADDDAEIHEDLLDQAWKVKRIGIWPMGNLGPTGFEGPTWKDGKIDTWETAGAERLYPVDNGAFTYPSSILGTEILGPQFYPIDNNGGESDFMDTFVRSWDDFESICDDPTDCHLAWHDQPIEISHLWIDDIEYPF